MYMLLYQIAFELTWIKLKLRITSNWAIFSDEAVLNYCPYGAEATAVYLDLIGLCELLLPSSQLEKCFNLTNFRWNEVMKWVMNATVSNISLISTVYITDVNINSRDSYSSIYFLIWCRGQRWVFFFCWDIWSVQNLVFICIHKLVHSSFVAKIQHQLQVWYSRLCVYSLRCLINMDRWQNRKKKNLASKGKKLIWYFVQSSLFKFIFNVLFFSKRCGLHLHLLYFLFKVSDISTC